MFKLNGFKYFKLDNTSRKRQACSYKYRLKYEKLLRKQVDNNSALRLGFQIYDVYSK